MADSSEASSHAEGTSNGVSNGASGSLEASRAAFIARDMAAAQAAPAGEAKPVVADDDSDLDVDEAAASGDADADLDSDDDAPKAAASDDDSDLDDEDEIEKGVDADTKKRLASVRRTDQRLREQRERQWKAEDAKLADREAKLAEREAKTSKAERLIERLKNPYELGDVLAELGYSEDDFEPASQSTFARSKKFAADPNAKATVAKLKHDRERDERLAKLEKADEERRAAEAETREAAEAQQRVETFISTTAKATTEKTPLAAALIEKNPARAREQIAAIAGRLWDETGSMPTSKQVIIALEKTRRQDLRDAGVDPKTITTVAAAKKQTDAPVEKATASKKVAVPTTVKTDEKKKTSLKDDFINRKFD